MTANKARFALTLSLALALAACGGGGGGGGGDDDGGSNEPPSGFGDFDGSYTIYGPNGAPDASFDDTLPAEFTDGEGTVGAVATEFDYPSPQGSDGCYYSGDAIQHCVQQAQGNLIALCTSSNADLLAAVGVSDDPTSTFEVVDLDGLKLAADGKIGDLLEFDALTCAGTLDPADSVSLRKDGTLIQVGIPDVIPQGTAQLFSPAGNFQNTNPPARLGARAFKFGTTYYVLNFGAPATGNTRLQPKLFVSTN